MLVISLTGQKGGPGKSSMSIGLAVAATEAGERVLVVDCDPQGTLKAWAQSRHGKPPLVAVLPRPDRLPALLSEAQARFSVAVLDTAGRDDALTHAAISASDITLIPIRPTRLDALGQKPSWEACVRSGRKWAFLMNQVSTSIFSHRAHEMAEGLKTLGVLAEPRVGLRVDFQDAYAAGQGPTEYNPEGKAADEMRQLWRWIQSEVKK